LSARHISSIAIATALWFVTCNPAAAQNSGEARDHAVGLKAGLLGIGIDYSYRFSDRLGLRLGINGSGVSYDDTESGIEYDFDLDFDSLAVGIDVHPAKGAFRLSFGLLQNDSSISAIGIGTGTYTIGDTVYTGAEVGTLRGAVGFDGTAPFAGLGWDFRQGKRLGLALDFGVVDQGAPLVTLSADGPIASDPDFLADLAAEQAELQESLDDLDLYPFASFGFVFRF
jgi:hypothetical protein